MEAHQQFFYRTILSPYYIKAEIMNYLHIIKWLIIYGINDHRDGITNFHNIFARGYLFYSLKHSLFFLYKWYEAIRIYLPQSRSNTRLILQNITGLNSKFSFFKIGCLKNPAKPIYSYKATRRSQRQTKKKKKAKVRITKGRHKLL